MNNAIVALILIFAPVGIYAAPLPLGWMGLAHLIFFVGTSVYIKKTQHDSSDIGMLGWDLREIFINLFIPVNLAFIIRYIPELFWGGVAIAPLALIMTFLITVGSDRSASR